MQIDIKSPEQFQRLLTVLVSELTQGWDHFALYRDLTDAKKEFGREFTQTWTFWYLTFRAHLDAAVIRLCKAYDQNASGLNLRNLIDTIDANRHLFDKPHLRERLKGNPFVDSLVDDAQPPDTQQLEADRRAVMSADPLVKTLTVWRNNLFAHRSPEHAVDAEAFSAKRPLRFDDVEALFGKGLEIVNRYSVLFMRTSHSRRIHGHEDYKTLLKAVRTSLEVYEAGIQEDIRKASQP